MRPTHVRDVHGDCAYAFERQVPKFGAASPSWATVRSCLRQSGAALVLLTAACTGALAQAPAMRASGDPLKSPACVDARRDLNAAEAALKPGQAPSSADLKRLRQKVADVCLRAEADTPSARVLPPIAVPPVSAGIGATAGIAQPRAPALPVITPLPTPTPPTGPTQVSRCDAGGCWDSNGARLNRSGPFLVNPQGAMCTKVGTIVQCP